VHPHMLQASYGGEDAFFISNAGGGALGIADGVGGWQDSGINPAGEKRTLRAVSRVHAHRQRPGTTLLSPELLARAELQTGAFGCIILRCCRHRLVRVVDLFCQPAGFLTQCCLVSGLEGLLSERAEHSYCTGPGRCAACMSRALQCTA
jgi:hypothetical protein